MRAADVLSEIRGFTNTTGLKTFLNDNVIYHSQRKKKGSQATGTMQSRILRLGRFI